VGARAPPGFDTRDLKHLSYDYARYEGLEYSEFYEVMFARMRPVAPVLELGPGLGFFLECCRRHGVEACGLESSGEGAAACAVRGLRVVRGDVTLPLPFRDDTFGSALAHHVLEHLPVQGERRALREVHRVLRPGGFLFAVSPNAHVREAHEEPDHINLFTPRQLALELRSAGYRKVSLGTNYWRPIWEPAFRLGRAGKILSGALWKIAPIDRFAGTASAMAWK